MAEYQGICQSLVYCTMYELQTYEIKVILFEILELQLEN